MFTSPLNFTFLNKEKDVLNPPTLVDKKKANYTSTKPIIGSINKLTIPSHCRLPTSKAIIGAIVNSHTKQK